MNTMNRRAFIKSSMLTAASLSLPAYSWAQVRGANDDIRVAVVGFNGQGGHERFETEQEMYDTYMRYYDRPVDAGTAVKIIRFEIESIHQDLTYSID